MAKITIGGTQYTVPELSFMALERAWPFVESAMVSDGRDPMKGPNAAMRIIAAGILHDDNFDPEKFKVTAGADDEDLQHDQIVQFFRRRLKAREIPTLTSCIDDIMVEAGLAAPAGEAKDPLLEESPNPSMETAPVTLPSS
jgi:hypothetical protein